MREARFMREDDMHSLRAECCVSMSGDHAPLPIADVRGAMGWCATRPVSVTMASFSWLGPGCCLRSIGLPYAADVAVRVRTFTR
jgi:hypothetical protein